MYSSFCKCCNVYEWECMQYSVYFNDLLKRTIKNIREYECVIITVYR